MAKKTTNIPPGNTEKRHIFSALFNMGERSRHVWPICPPLPPTAQPILVSLGSHSRSVSTLVVVSDGRGSTFGLLEGFHITNMSLI